MTKKTIEDELNEFLEIWDAGKTIDFLSEIMPLIDLYSTDKEEDWVAEIVGMDDANNVRLIRTVYLLSKISDFYSGILCKTSVHHPALWKRIEKEVDYKNQHGW